MMLKGCAGAGSNSAGRESAVGAEPIESSWNTSRAPESAIMAARASGVASGGTSAGTAPTRRAASISSA
jgi:hypothetical protein